MARYDTHDIVVKLRGSPEQFDQNRLRQDAADEIEILRQALRSIAEARNDKQRLRSKGAASAFLVVLSVLVLSGIAMTALGAVEYSGIGLYALFLSPLVGAMMPDLFAGD